MLQNLLHQIFVDSSPTAGVWQDAPVRVSILSLQSKEEGQFAGSHNRQAQGPNAELRRQTGKLLRKLLQ